MLNHKNNFLKRKMGIQRGEKNITEQEISDINKFQKKIKAT